MCGINGLFAYHYAANPIDPRELVRTRDQMAARGPDGEGSWIAADGRAGFGHRRLSIIDLSKAASQPMASDDGKIVVAFNGEIYNYRKLRHELLAKGHTFRSHSDTEVLLHLYACKGAAMVKDLRGMFAFAIWDENRRTMFLARDPYGIKPLYYADDGWTFRFASQVQALLAGGGVSRDADPAGRVGFALFGSVPEPFTMRREIRGASCGLHAHCRSRRRARTKALSFDRAGLLRRGSRGGGGGGRRARQRAGRRRVPRGVARQRAPPSGGRRARGGFSVLGRGFLRACWADARRRPAGHPDRHAVLRRIQRASRGRGPARRGGGQALWRQATRCASSAKANSPADLPRIFEAMDQPSIDGVNTWFVAKAARELGLKVAISGVGGDELFGGYSSFRDMPRWVAGSKFPDARLSSGGWRADGGRADRGGRRRQPEGGRDAGIWRQLRRRLSA